MTQPDLFDLDGLWVEPPAPDCDLGTVGERRRARQDAAVAGGYHPLYASLGLVLRLHPDRDLRCGSCRFRVLEQNHMRSYPKCRYPDPVDRPAGGWPRVTHGPGTDVLARWPACTDYQPQGAQR